MKRLGLLIGVLFAAFMVIMLGKDKKKKKKVQKAEA